MNLQRITDIAKKLGIEEEALTCYGPYKAKVDPNHFASLKENGKLILVTAITPTKAGEGKTTISIALADGLNLIGEKAALALREPSLGPVFGLKGGATGGGKVTVEPSLDINLHFTGDMHALTASNNLIASIIDNHIYQGNELDIKRVVFQRAMDINDRSLRQIKIGMGKNNGIERDDSFVITVATELMAILTLAKDKEDFVRRLKKIIIGYDSKDEPVMLEQLRITKALMKLLEETLKPNLVQTKSGTPAFIHGGPFANIAHGCNSIIATKLGLKLSDYLVTEAGFGSDLGAEKFLDIKCQEGDLIPSTIVLVATIRALKAHGGASDLTIENLDALKIGLANLDVHIENMLRFGPPVVVALNHFASDTVSEIKILEDHLREKDIPFAFVDGFILGATGATDLAELVKKAAENTNKKILHYTYSKDDELLIKVSKIAKSIYRAEEVIYTDKAKEVLKAHSKLIKNFYPCIAKTPLSLSDNPKLVNAPTGHRLHVKDVHISAGAEFVVLLTGNVLTMPGLPKIPSAVKMEDEDNGN